MSGSSHRKGASTPPDSVSSLLTTLQATARALSSPSPVGNDDNQAARTANPSGADEHEARFPFPALAAEERELLADGRAETLSDLLGKVHDHFYATVMLMKNLDQDVKFPGFAVRIFGEQLEPSLDLLMRARCFLYDAELASVSDVE